MRDAIAILVVQEDVLYVPIDLPPHHSSSIPIVKSLEAFRKSQERIVLRPSLEVAPKQTVQIVPVWIILLDLKESSIQ